MSASAPTPAQRELAARAICKVRGLPENTLFDGVPLWERFLPEVDAMIEALREEFKEEAGDRKQV